MNNQKLCGILRADCAIGKDPGAICFTNYVIFLKTGQSDVI